jgi:hypothetical protein
MSEDALRRLFSTVLTAPPPDTTDIDAAMRTGRRRRHVRTASVVLSAAAAVAAVAGTTTAVLPGPQRQATAPVASGAGTTAPATAYQGTKVTDVRALLGTWHTTWLDGRDVRAARNARGEPLWATFTQRGVRLRWYANDDVNTCNGTFSVSRQGVLLAQDGGCTLALGRNTFPYLRNSQVVFQATEARVVAATATGPEKLLLLTGGQVVAVYIRASPS